MTSPSVLHTLLPAPRRVIETPGTLRLAPGCPVTVAAPELLPIAVLLVARLTDWAVVVPAPPHVGSPVPGGIHLAVDASDADVRSLPAARGLTADAGDPGAERSALSVTAGGVRVVGAALAGLHRAATTLACLAEQASLAGETLDLPLATIIDGPALAWRGLSFDVVRQSFTPAEVRRVIDLLDRYRMNVLHLHLTDDQGWRLEIPARPALTAGPGASFTTAEYAEIVAYASERFITVVPEIDMPGHSGAAIAAYPHLSRIGTAPQLPADPLEAIAAMASGAFEPAFLDPGKDAVWDFVDDVIAAVAAVTPGAYIHIGGDEAFGMPQPLHDAFVQRARTIARAHGKEPIGWQEASRAPAEPGEVLQLWVDPATMPTDDNPLLQALPPEVVRMLSSAFAESSGDPGRMIAHRAQVIVSRTGTAYLDAPYAERSDDPDAERMRARLGMPGYPAVTIEHSATAPIEGLDAETDLDVAGFEAAIWCETVGDLDDLTFLLLPRLPVLAQRAWGSERARDWDDVRTRLAAQAPSWRRDGHAFFPASSVDWPADARTTHNRGTAPLQRRTMTRVPHGFLWGASTSAHQVEGNNVSSDIWRIEGSGPIMAEYSGDAVDSYHRYPEDMRLLADAGLNAYRFGIEWARIEPEKDRWSRAELAHYRRMIDTARAAGLEPVVTLHHFTSPHWFAEDGGWMGESALERWALYVEKVSSILGDVEWVCTINEPNMVSLMQVFLSASALPDGLGGGITLAHDGPLMPDTAIAERLVEAHRIATRILRERITAKVGWTVAQQAFTPTPGNEEVFARVNHAWEDLYLEASREDDFVGVQSYTTQPVDENGPVPHPPHPDNTITGWAYRPDALGMALRHAHEVAGVPLLVTENGIATDDDERRIAYTREALRHLTAAIDDGLDVRGYLHWSALDNYEWGHWAPTFGLIAVDRETFQRHPKPSLAWLGTVARTGAADIPAGTASFAPDAGPSVGADAAAPLFSTASTVGDLLDDARSRAVLDELAPGVSSHAMIGMARGFTLAAVAGMAKDLFTPEVLEDLDSRLRAIA